VGEIFRLDHTVVLDVLADSPVGPTARAKRANIESGTYLDFSAVVATILGDRPHP
jgi:hypothetical protein